jgi:hypothetical protein
VRVFIQEGRGSVSVSATLSWFDGRGLLNSMSGVLSSLLKLKWSLSEWFAECGTAECGFLSRVVCAEFGLLSGVCRVWCAECGVPSVVCRVWCAEQFAECGVAC